MSDSRLEVDVLLGLAFWTVITLFAGALPVRMPRGTFVRVSIAPIVAAMALGGPVAAGWVALIGTTELREVRGRSPLVRHRGQSRRHRPAGPRSAALVIGVARAAASTERPCVDVHRHDGRRGSALLR